MLIFFVKKIFKICFKNLFITIYKFIIVSSINWINKTFKYIKKNHIEIISIVNKSILNILLHVNKISFKEYQ